MYNYFEEFEQNQIYQGKRGGKDINAINYSPADCYSIRRTLIDVFDYYRLNST
jgi:hypothetical protein